MAHNPAGGLDKASQEALGIYGDTIPEGLMVRERTVLIALNPLFGATALRDDVELTGSGTVTDANSEFNLKTTASGTDSASLNSAEHVRYIAGYAAEVGIGVRLQSTAPTGNQDARWGLYDDHDDNEGLFFGRDATGLYVAIRRGGSTTKTYQSGWNQDPLDGTGPSGLTLDLSIGHIYQIRYFWYGYGAIEWVIQILDDDNVQRGIVVHRAGPGSSGTTVQNPNLSIHAQIDNAGTATAYDMYVAGRQYSILGKYERKVRVTAEYRLQLGSVGTTFLPIVGFRRKTGAVFGGVGLIISGMDFLSTGDLVWKVVQAPTTLTDASWGTPTDMDATETAVESETSATAISGGIPIHQGFVGSGAGNQTSLSNLDLVLQDMVENDEYVLAVRAVSGTATVSALMHVTEDW